MPEHPAADLALLESFDSHAGLRNGLRRIATERKEWAGIPMPLDGERLVVEPTYPKAAELMRIGAPIPERGESHLKLRNTFYSAMRMSDILVIEDKGRITWGIEHGIHHFDYDIKTLGCADAWGIEQESNAVQTLAGLVTHRQFKHYMLTGMFLETSSRSHVTYMFRRLKPTVAMTPRKGETMQILCCLCMHPIAYYAGSWAGAMCPTDDVIAHLMLMRGDEKMFWRRCNQHAAYRPEAGL